MSSRSAKKAKLENLPQCPYGISSRSRITVPSFASLGDKCYRNNPVHFQEYLHSNTASTTPAASSVSPVTDKVLPVCPFGATCYRKNLLHYAEFTHPFNLLDPDADDSDEEETKPPASTTETKKRKAESEEYDDGEKTEEYNSDDVSSERRRIPLPHGSCCHVGKCVRHEAGENLLENE